VYPSQLSGVSISSSILLSSTFLFSQRQAAEFSKLAFRGWQNNADRNPDWIIIKNNMRRKDLITFII
jgi:hypothetical protein